MPAWRSDLRQISERTRSWRHAALTGFGPGTRLQAPTRVEGTEDRGMSVDVSEHGQTSGS